MTSKHGAGVARANLYVAKQRAAAALSAPKTRKLGAKQLAEQEKARLARVAAKKALGATEPTEAKPDKSAD